MDLKAEASSACLLLYPSSRRWAYKWLLNPYKTQEHRDLSYFQMKLSIISREGHISLSNQSTEGLKFTCSAEQRCGTTEFREARIPFSLILCDTNLPLSFPSRSYHGLVLCTAKHWFIPCPLPSHGTYVFWFNHEALWDSPIYQANK